MLFNSNEGQDGRQRQALAASWSLGVKGEARDAKAIEAHADGAWNGRNLDLHRGFRAMSRVVKPR